MIVLDLEVVEELGQCDKIGEPKALEPSEAKAQPTTISSDGFYGNRIPPQQQQQPVAQQWQSRPGGGQQSHPALVPIEALSPYSHRWTIKARCTHKGEIKHWHNKNGEGKLFSANFLDETGEIRATGFNEQCDALYDVLQEGSVYYISTPCKVQLAKKQFTNLNNDYELTFERETLVEKVCLVLYLLSSSGLTYILNARPRTKTTFHRFDTTLPPSATFSLSKRTLLSTLSEYSRMLARFPKSRPRQQASRMISGNLPLSITLDIRFV